MAQYKVTQRQQPPPKPRRPLASILIRAMPGIIGLGLVGLGLLEIVAVHAGGHNENSRAGVGLIVIGVVLVMFWSLRTKSGGYNF
jgi:hypothetical protein